MLAVLIHKRLAGYVTRRDNGACEFSYEAEYAEDPAATPLSVTAPLGDSLGPYPVDAWLSGLLPDDPEVVRLWRDEVDAASTHPMDLFATGIGRECAGAVQFCTPENLEEALGAPNLGALTVPDTLIAEWCEHLAQFSSAWFGTSNTGMHARFSLAGMQSKFVLRYWGNEWHLPFGELPTTHIFKPDIRPEFPHMVLVEHLCQTAARILGLSAAETTIERFDDRLCIVVKRYDRQETSDGLDQRLHQEDMCQALGVSPDHKYQSDGGPTPARIASLLNNQTDKLALFDALAYNALIVGTDAHAKNYSLILSGREIYFAPLYDLCSFLPFRGFEPIGKLKLAMRAGARDYSVQKSDRPNSWLRTTEQIGVRPSDAAQRLGKMSSRLVAAIDAAIAALPNEMAALPEVERLAQDIRVRASTGERLAEALQRNLKQMAASSAQPDRCDWTGQRSQKQCILKQGHPGPHRY